MSLYASCVRMRSQQLDVEGGLGSSSLNDVVLPGTQRVKKQYGVSVRHRHVNRCDGPGFHISPGAACLFGCCCLLLVWLLLLACVACLLLLVCCCLFVLLVAGENGMIVL